MSIMRGPFILKCGHENCGTYIELETFSFDEALDQARDVKHENGWTTLSRGGKYIDICPNH